MSTATDDPFYNSHIDWPGPNRYRSSNGAPGPDYWQQRADYTITAALDTTNKMVSGTVSVRYRNNSPDTLHYVWMQIDQNLYKPGSWGSAINPANSRWGVRGFAGGYDLSNVQVDGRTARFDVSDTRMRVNLDRPMAPKGSAVTITMGFRFRVPEHGSDRMGRDGTLYEIAQWYPRMAVYDDVRGWNTDPYLGQGEFYLEYGDIDFSVTAPAGYTIAATGVLQNPAQVLTAAERTRLAQASRSTSAVVPIITGDEAHARVTPGSKTWHFIARNVRDVAWAGAPDFRWDAVSTGPIEGNPEGVLAQSYYQIAKAGKAWESAAEQTQFSIKHYSELLFPYPYPQATSVAGTVGGMEYPMFVMVHYGSVDGDPASIFGTINHEHGHEWFPMIVGSNERRYAWMDEGFNTYINTFALEKRYAGTQRGMDVYPAYLKNYRDVRDRGIESPLMTAPDHINLGALGAIGYRKPAVVLLTLRNHVVGKDAFDAAFRRYIRNWAFKHPTPGDFFRTVENYAGADLSWYWHNMFYTTRVLDIGVAGVTANKDSTTTVVLKNVGGIPFPVTMRVKFASGRTQDITLPVDVWAAGDTFNATVLGADKVTGVRLWPDPSVPDWNPANNSWGDVPAANQPGLVTQ